ncbi:MAG TPA: PQQ-binding-like beta-propeller repeat protein [Pseudomonadales bacterium]
MTIRSLVLSAALLGSTCALAQQVVTAPENTAGQQVYDSTCATCHDNPEATKSPPLDTLKRMGPRAVSYALTNGKMKAQAAGLSPQQVDDVVSYLSATANVDNSWIAANTCPSERMDVDTAPVHIGQWGFDARNHRHLTAEQAGLTTEQLGKLELAWVMAFPSTANMRAQPVVVGDTMYLSIVDSGQLFALDVGGASPCVKWVYEHDVPLRTALGYHTYGDRNVLLFADAAAHVLMMDAVTTEVLWNATVKVTSVSNVTAMPVLFEDKVFVPISSGELNMGAAPDYECCTSHGAVVALNADDGERLWVYHTMEDAKPTTVSRVGTQQWGPSGAPIWTAAAVDAKRRLIYVGTGENTSAPATDTSDAILAIRMDDGSLAWKYQTTPNDIFLTGCMNDPEGPNCPPETSINKDWDFGAGLMLANRTDGSDLVIAGQKNGVVWAFNPDNGELVWETKVGPGGAMGGVHWGMAFDGKSRLYVPNNMSTGPTADGEEPGLHALDIDTGNILWSYLHKPDCSGERATNIPSCERNYGMSAATLLVDGAVIQGANDGFVKIFDAQRGEPLFTFDTARPFDTVNGVEGKGGAIDNANMIAANGMLFVQSGYGLMGVPGNVLLAFKPAP